MQIFRKKLTEKQAACHFVTDMLIDAREQWPTIYTTLKSYDANLIVEDEAACDIHLALAAIALDMQAVNNLFSPEQSKRLVGFVFRYLDEIDESGYVAKEARKYDRVSDRLLRNLETRGYIVHEVKRYQQVFQEAIRNSENPIHAITVRLLARWLGVSSQQGQFVNLVLTILISAHLAAFSGFWKETKATFKVVPI